MVLVRSNKLFAVGFSSLSIILIFHLYSRHVLHYHYLSKDAIWFERDHVLVKDPNYSIKTIGCQIPEFDPFDDRVLNYLEDLSPFTCPCVDGNGLTYMENSTLKVNTHLLARYDVQLESTPSEKFNCCVRIVYRRELEDEDNFTR